MSEAPNPPNAQAPSEIPLEDIDKLLEAEDPGFSESLNEVRAVEPDANVTIEATAKEEEAEDSAAVSDKPEVKQTRWRMLRAKWKANAIARRQRRREWRARMARESLIFLKTKPKEFALFAFALLKSAVKQAAIPLKAFREADRRQRLTALVLLALSAVCVWILLANFKGVWLPRLEEPILNSFESVANSVSTYNAKDDGESFYTAFPQERHEYLFPKMKVNLRRTPDHPLPMGAFELVVQVDSKDTAIEVSDREVELSDLLQRVLEDQTFNDLESELGKQRLKSAIKRELDQKLTQGWIKDVNFKTFILKP